MLPTPVEIKEKLLKALDDKNNVDDGTILEMVVVLEKYPITRATLEETRIGKMVNDLRRKVTDEKLAKRIKQLVRNWKKILDQTAPPVNGTGGAPVHPAVSQLQSSPAVSPALSPSPGRLASPAQSLPLRCASPAVDRRASRPTTPVTIAQRVASPALASARPRPPVTPAGPGRSLSPAVSAKVTSPAVTGRKVVSPAVTGRLSSLATTSGGRVASPYLSGRVASPASGGGRERRSPLVGTSPIQSPALRTTVTGLAGASTRQEERGDPGSKRKAKGRGSGLTEVGGRATPTSLHSDNSQDRLVQDNGRHDSDNESSSSSSRLQPPPPANHSASTPVATANKNSAGRDQRELSKTNVANRKRTRVKSDSSPDGTDNKRAKLESCSLSTNSHKPDKLINGCVSKSNKRGGPDVDLGRVSSTHSLPLLSEDSAVPHTNSLFHQENSDSRLSLPSFDKSSRDKNKVKTTEQLIEELQKKNKSSHVGNSIMTKLRTNQIEKEKDTPGSVLPMGMKPRGKRGGRCKNDDVNLSVPSSDVMLMSRVKSELVERFLKTSEPSPGGEEYSPFRDDLLPDPARLEGGHACGSAYSKDNFDGSYSASRQDHSEPTPRDESSLDALSPAGPSSSAARTGSAMALHEIYAQLPPVDHDIDWDAVDFYQLPEPMPVTEESVQSLHTERLPYVNGMPDLHGNWSSWQQMVTLPSFEGNMLHILPYVDLDN